MTKVHIGKNGDQQRVFVEQEFSNQHEYKKFMKNLKHNFEKTFKYPHFTSLLGVDTYIESVYDD